MPGSLVEPVETDVGVVAGPGSLVEPVETNASVLAGPGSLVEPVETSVGVLAGPGSLVEPVETNVTVASDPVIVVVDGGGTKTDVIVLGLDGRVLAGHRAGAFIPQFIGPGPAARELNAVVSPLLRAFNDPPVAVAGVYFSGLDFAFEVEAFRAELGRFGWASQTLLVDNDVFALMRVGTDEPTAVAVVCGTGMNCIGRGATGEVVRFAALGDVSGDWGGGASLGHAALWHAARAADGRGPATALEPLVLRALGCATMAEVIEGYHTQRLPEDGIPGLAPLIFEAAGGGDEAALGVVGRQADELVAFARAAIVRLGVLDQPCPVVLGGGVIAARDPLLLAAIEERLAKAAPLAKAVVVSAPPILGAALLALDAVGAPAAAHARVREALAG